MSEEGKAQREAVTVIFKTLGALACDDLALAGKLLDKALSLDAAKVNGQLLEVIGSVIDSGKSPSSLESLLSVTTHTPYEDAASKVANDRLRPRK